MPEGITVRGIPQVQANLKGFPRILVMGCFAKALSRAAGVFEEALAAECPEAEMETTSSEKYGTLLENIMSIVTIDTQGRGGRASIGFGKKGFVAVFIEYGHRMMTHQKKDTGKFVPQNPFMRRAFSRAADKALEAFTEEVENFMQSGSAAA